MVSPHAWVANLPTRRDFLKTAAALGVVTPFVVPAALAAGDPDKLTPQIENDTLSVAFDVETGRLRCSRKGGQRLLSGVIARANSATGRRSTDQSAYRRRLDTRRVEDALGSGRQLIATCADDDGQLDFDVRATLYDGFPAVIIEAACRNRSSRALVLESIEPVCALATSHGRLHWPGVNKVLTNGPMYYDPGLIADLPRAAPPLRSWWNIALFRAYDQEGLACGYLDNQAALGQVSVGRDGDAIQLRAESVLARGFELPPGRTAHSGRFIIHLAANPYAALEGYADAMGKSWGARVHSLVNGWCNWFSTYEHITEDEVLRNAELAARTLKPFGLETIQVDEGFQRWHGDWEGNARFPHGMKWLADRIRALGLKPGIWLAPYVISEPTEVFDKHKDWLIRHPDGRLKRVGPWPSEDSEWARNENPKRYGLDITHPDAAAWLAALVDTVANRWGYEMLKIDFVDWSLLSAHRYYDATVTRAQAYRRGFEIMRKVLGPDRHLQDCGPGPVTVGLLDSMRIELDQNYGYRQRAWQQYFGPSTSSASAAAKRYYFHKRTWINDADHVCLNLLSVPQAQAAATLIALSGGNLISGDRLPDLDPVRLDILRKVIPSYGEAARPVDLFDSDRQSVFALRIEKPFAAWTVVGLFNANETETLERTFPLERLWLDPAKTYLAYDFWQERLHGEISGRLQVTIPPASVTLLALHQKRNVPQLVSTDRHVLQGAVELESLVWNAGAQTITGISLGPPGSAHNLALYLPEQHPWVQGGHCLVHEFPGFSAKMVDDHILRVRVRFDATTRLKWQVNLARIFAEG